MARSQVGAWERAEKYDLHRCTTYSVTMFDQSLKITINFLPVAYCDDVHFIPVKGIDDPIIAYTNAVGMIVPLHFFGTWRMRHGSQFQNGDRRPAFDFFGKITQIFENALANAQLQ